VLAVSVEPLDGSSTGLPTGSVLYKGDVLTRPP
jgi:anti-sigma-K factor RskA